MYTQKGTYNLEVQYSYFDRVAQQNKTGKLPVGSILVRSEIAVTNNGTRLGVNDNNTEVLAGDTPARLVFDAKNIFTDFGFTNSSIVWDLNGDGVDEADKENKAFFSANYTKDGLYYVRYRLPENKTYPLYYYEFPLRLLQSNVPTCVLSQKSTSSNALQFERIWESDASEVNRMQFEVYNLTKEQTVQTLPTNNATFSYSLPNNDQYVVRYTFSTIEGKNGFCESQTLNANKASYTIDAAISWKKPQDTQYAKITATSPEVSIKNDTLTSTYAPIDIQVTINSITPALPENATVTALLDDKTMNAEKVNVFSTRAYGPKTQYIKIVIDDGKGNISEKTRPISFNQSALR